MVRTLRLGINVDHVATLRNARGGPHPDPVRAALEALGGGADGITAHLREDRRHIRDADIARLRAEVPLPLNLEMAGTAEMTAIALNLRPHAVCLVPERRNEVTTEGGLDVAGQIGTLKPVVTALAAAGIRVSLFIDPDPHQVDAAAAVGAPVVELHTGSYCEPQAGREAAELQRLVEAARRAEACGIECHAGHGLTYATVRPVAAIPSIRELNIGHFLVGEAVFVGFAAAVRRMRQLMDEARID
jgi:pyridoxine 5-phosphate synthase